MTTNFLHVTELCKQDNANCGQEDWSIRACNYLANQASDPIKESDISLCANTYIVNGTLNPDTLDTSYNVEVPNNDYFIASASPVEQVGLEAWSLVNAFESSFNDIIMKLDDRYDSPHNHSDTDTVNNPVGHYFHKHQDDDPTKPVDFSIPNTGSMVTPHKHTSSTSSDGTTTYNTYPLGGIDRASLTSDVMFGQDINNETNWSFIQDHWKGIYIIGDSPDDYPVGISAEKWIEDLSEQIKKIEDITKELKDNYNSSSEDVGCKDQGNLGKATSNGECITNYHLTSKCEDETTGQYFLCSSLKNKENKKYQKNLNSSHAAKLSAKNQTMLYNINVSACVNLVIGILLLLFIIFKLFKLPSPTKKIGEVASKVSDGAKKTANAAKKNVGKATNVAKDGAAIAAKKTAESAKKGMAQIDNLTNAAKAPPKPNLKK